MGTVEIVVSGMWGRLQLHPDSFDIREIRDLFDTVETLLFPQEKKKRPLITYRLEEGSVRNIFRTSLQAVISLTAVLAHIKALKSIDFMEAGPAAAIEELQRTAIRKNYAFQITTSHQPSVRLEITPETRLFRSEQIWVDAEFYFYGELKDAGGKNKANIHLDTPDHGYLTIRASRDFLSGFRENLLYKKWGARVRGKQHLHTGQIDTRSLQLVELFPYEPRFDEAYLQSLIDKATPQWEDVDPEQWLAEIRGDADQ